MINLDKKKLSKWLMIYLFILCIMMFAGTLLAITYNPENTEFLMMGIIVIVIFVLPLVLNILLFLEIDSEKIKGLEKIEKKIRKTKINMGMVYGVPIILEIVHLIYLIMIFGVIIIVYTSIFK